MEHRCISVRVTCCLSFSSFQLEGPITRTEALKTRVPQLNSVGPAIRVQRDFWVWMKEIGRKC